MRRTACLVVATGIPLLLAAGPAVAAGAPEGPSFLWAAVKMLLSLAVVLGILLAISHYSKKYMDRLSQAGGAGRSLSVSEIRRIGPKAQIVVLEAFGARYLLGLSPAGFSLIDKVRDDTAERSS
ncbi:MAG: FliO/MopB family protein [Deltaproteobacteria bacterium]|nr:FliO/MopB family protein [Deltaproteobacteria bacterium]